MLCFFLFFFVWFSLDVPSVSFGPWNAQAALQEINQELPGLLESKHLKARQKGSKMVSD